jgi:hypothetical protein
VMSMQKFDLQPQVKSGGPHLQQLMVSFLVHVHHQLFAHPCQLAERLV